MKLIRDIDNVSMRIYLYFECDGERISPRFANQQLAAEWYAQFKHAQYPHPDRRSSYIDRRCRRQYYEFDSRASHRRESDRELLIEDRASRALREIRALIVEREESGIGA